jgi:hypothetical protein
LDYFTYREYPGQASTSTISLQCSEQKISRDEPATVLKNGIGSMSASYHRGDFSDEKALRRIWLLSMGVSVGTVAFLFTYVNVSNWHGGSPLGYDSYYYVVWINQVVANGPLQFAASQHYVEFLYPIVASIPVYLGVSANAVEVVLPAILACSLVVATGVLARESKDWRVAILSVAFSSGWFAVYRMGADFHANLFAFPLLILASALLIRVSRTGQLSGSALGIFLVLVVLASAAHVETTDFFIVAWFAASVLLGWRTSPKSWRLSSLMTATGAAAASPLTLAYLRGAAGGLGAQYCIFPPYWLEVFGPAVGLAILGIGVTVVRYRVPTSEGSFSKLLFSWSGLAVAIGVLGYFSLVPIVLSDRALLLFPLPFVSSIGMIWLVEHVPKLHRYSQVRILAIFAIVVPLLTAPIVFSYAYPYFRYFAEHGPSLVTCATK